MREIPLTKGMVALVDDEDYARLNPYKWSAQKHRNTYYAQGWVQGRTVLMHRFIKAVSDRHVLLDHKNRNGLDNRRDNLRIATHGENRSNSKSSKNNTSGFRGVSWYKRYRKWQVIIQHHGVKRWCGLFDCPEEAARAYDEMARQLHGDFATLNFPTEVCHA